MAGHDQVAATIWLVEHMFPYNRLRATDPSALLVAVTLRMRVNTTEDVGVEALWRQLASHDADTDVEVRDEALIAVSIATDRRRGCLRSSSACGGSHRSAGSRAGDYMEFSFRTRTLLEMCETPEKADAKFGPVVGNQLRGRLADLRAARRLSDLVVGVVGFSGITRDVVHISIGNRVELQLRVGHREVPCGSDGCVDWQQVHRVQVIEIGADDG